jgi:uncharacterized protein YndB with AHSA1/START domain
MSFESLNVTDECQIVSTRVFHFSRERVFDAWSDPAKLQVWWGPAGFTNTFEEFNFTPGGIWRFVMHGPDGKGNYKNECRFLRIEPPTLITWERISKPLFRIVTTFEESGANKTLLTFRMQFETAEECDKIRPFAVEKNEENFDKLEKVLAST